MKYVTDNDFGTDVPVPGVTVEDAARVARMCHDRLIGDELIDLELLGLHA